MTQVYITIDTEYSIALCRRLGRDAREENYLRSIRCRTPGGDVGIGYQMDQLDRYGHKAVFFVDPLPGLLWGTGAIADIVEPILARGHDVQLHLHSEWLELAGDANPLGTVTGRNIKDFTQEQQAVLIDTAMRVLIDAGAPRPIAFRAGNYGANDDTLRALAELGIAYDTSHSPGFRGSACAISLDGRHLLPMPHCGVIEVPIGAIRAFGAARRHAQITALSMPELMAAIRFAAAAHIPAFTVVSHSFELMSRDRVQMNRIVRHRFDSFCARLARMHDCRTATYAADPPVVAAAQLADAVEPLPHSIARTSARVVEQLMSNSIYGSS